MKLKLWVLPVVCLYFLLISASTTSNENIPVVAEKEVVKEAAPELTVKKEMKLNFFQRAILKHAAKKYKLDEKDTVTADKNAKLALILGASALGLLIIGLFVPYVIFASIPAGIMAMIFGSSALREGTQQGNKARMGKGFGLSALIGFGVVLLLALIWIASWGAFG